MLSLLNGKLGGRDFRPLAFVLALVCMTAGPAWADRDDDDDHPSPATEFNDFLCVIDLAENGLNTTTYVREPIDTGKVSTFNSSKLCTNSRSEEVIKLRCRARIDGWIGGRVSKRNVACDVSAAACGVQTPDNQPIRVTNASLRVDSYGNAQLECEVKKRNSSSPR
ncbi:MAG: hypothetical protein U1E14_09560 [Geminicoccaceae bacterium]